MRFIFYSVSHDAFTIGVDEEPQNPLYIYYTHTICKKKKNVTIIMWDIFYLNTAMVGYD